MGVFAGICTYVHMQMSSCSSKVVFLILRDKECMENYKFILLESLGGD